MTGHFSPYDVGDSFPAERPDERAVHVIEDVLLATAMAAFVLDEKTRRLAFDVAELLLKARSQGRDQEVFDSARDAAAALPDWRCAACGEENPGTFDVCWSCGAVADDEHATLSDESQAVLAIDAAFHLELLGEPSSENAPDAGS